MPLCLQSTENILRDRSKRRPQSGGEGVCPVRTFCGQGGVLHTRTYVLLGVKDLRFFEIYGVSARTRGVESVQTSGGGQFCADVFYGRAP